MPEFTTPALPRDIHRGRLRETRRHYEWLKKNAGSFSQQVDGVERKDPAWKPLDRATSLRLAKRALRELREQTAATPDL